MFLICKRRTRRVSPIHPWVKIGVEIWFVHVCVVSRFMETYKKERAMHMYVFINLVKRVHMYISVFMGTHSLSHKTTHSFSHDLYTVLCIWLMISGMVVHCVMTVSTPPPLPHKHPNLHCLMCTLSRSQV